MVRVDTARLRAYYQPYRRSRKTNLFNVSNLNQTISLDDGVIGLAPNVTRPKDRLCVIHRCEASFIIRRIEEQKGQGRRNPTEILIFKLWSAVLTDL